MMESTDDKEVQPNAINPYVHKIFGEWFKKIILLVLVVLFITIFIVGLFKSWIDKEFSMNVFFLLLGLHAGKWFEHG